MRDIRHLTINNSNLTIGRSVAHFRTLYIGKHCCLALVQLLSNALFHRRRFWFVTLLFRGEHCHLGLVQWFTHVLSAWFGLWLLRQLPSKYIGFWLVQMFGHARWTRRSFHTRRWLVEHGRLGVHLLFWSGFWYFILLILCFFCWLQENTWLIAVQLKSYCK